MRESTETSDPGDGHEAAGFQPLLVSHRWSMDDELIGFNYDQDQRCRRWLRFLALLILVPCLVGLMVWDIYAGTYSKLSILVIPVVVGFSVRWSIGPMTERREICAKYADSPLADAVVKWEIDGDSLAVKWGDQLAASFSWALVEMAVQSSQGMLLYVCGRYWWIPAHCFDADGDRQRFIDLTREKVARYRRSGAVYKPVE